ncbi:MAG: HDOD domain-containing protein [bacterium]|nr:HDOD domain-containing protein [bacterium]
MTPDTQSPPRPEQADAEQTTAPQNWKTIRFDVLETIGQLPSLNRVVGEFLNLARREIYTARDFETVLSKDQALVARLLKVANSGLYGRSRSISTIPEAVVLIGLEHLTKIVYAVSAEGLIRKNLVHYDFHPESGFWVHGLGVAHAASVVADASTDCPLRGDEAYVAGLLHDVAKLVIDDFLPEQDYDRVTLQHEVEAVGLAHPDLAEYILRQWNLPEPITSTVRWHHDHENAGEWRLAAAAIVLAQEICNTWGVGRWSRLDVAETMPVDDFADLLAVLNIPDSRWEQIIWDVRQRLVHLDTVFTED